MLSRPVFHQIVSRSLDTVNVQIEAREHDVCGSSRSLVPGRSSRSLELLHNVLYMQESDLSRPLLNFRILSVIKGF